MATARKPRVKNLTKNKTEEVRNIETSLVNKEEVFRMLALAEATGLPLLLIGDPGVAKTRTVLEYAKAWIMKGVDKNNEEEFAKANEDFQSKVYILETDEGTKSSEVKGMPDMQKLFVENTYALNTPIAESEVVVINEVDKASSNIRNSLLGVMNERVLFNGHTKIGCKWKIFVATCNQIPREEIGNPFWDRFVLKLHVSRVTAGEMVKYYKEGARNYRESFTIGIPNKEEMNSVSIAVDKLEKFINVGYKLCSDRTLTYVPSLTQAVSFIWDVSVDKALIKVCSLMINNNTASQLQDQLLSPTMKQLTAKVDMLWSANTSDKMEKLLDEIQNMVQQHAAMGTLSQTEMEEINTSVNYIMDNVELEDDTVLEEGAEELEEVEEVA
jgi:hypothetical protein